MTGQMNEQAHYISVIYNATDRRWKVTQALPEQYGQMCNHLICSMSEETIVKIWQALFFFFFFVQTTVKSAEHTQRHFSKDWKMYSKL